MITEKATLLRRSICLGGRGEIRTHGPLAWTTVFKTVAVNRLATLPFLRVNYHKSIENSSFAG